MVNAQQWLDNNYPQESRSKVKEIHLNEPSLEGELDLGEFTHQDGVKVLIPLEVDASKLVIKNLPVSAEIIETVQAQKYIDQQYPTTQAKANCQFLNIGAKTEDNQEGISGKLLGGSLSLKGFTNLRILQCHRQNITSLDLTACVNLEALQCQKNQLTRLDLSSCPNLKMLGCNDNQLTELDVSNCSNLGLLNCGTNNLTNLDLTNCSQLTELNWTVLKIN